MQSIPTSKLDPQMILSGLRTQWLGQHIRFLDTVNSSMDRLGRMIDEGAPEGSVLLVDHQRRGRGRQKRIWQAPPGSSLMLSLYLGPRLRNLPPELVAQSSLALGLAACRSIDSNMANGLDSDPDSSADISTSACANSLPSPALAQDMILALPAQHCRMKWPNDLHLEGLKVGGILAEAAYSADGKLDRLILGIGINVSQSKSELPEGASSLSLARKSGKMPNRIKLCTDILTYCENYIGQLIAGQSLIPEWATRLNTLGHEVEARSLASGASRLRGRAVGLGPEGSLEILDAEGNIHRFLAGDISLRPSTSRP